MCSFLYGRTTAQELHLALTRWPTRARWRPV